MQQYAILKRHFERIGARLKVSDTSGATPNRWRPSNGFKIDIGSDRKGEYFDLVLYDNPGQFQVVDLSPKDRHLLLMVRLHPEGDTGSVVRAKFLCGHDERHWFVAGVDATARNVWDAKQRLKPMHVLTSESRRGVKYKERHRRKSKGFVRQGEWFFVPEPNLEVNDAMILRDEPLHRGSGKPHMAEEVYRIGGETVYVCTKYPNGLTEQERHELWLSEPRTRKYKWRLMMREPDVYARGRIRHPDHATVVIRGWHRVVPNAETTYVVAGLQPVAFLD